MHVTFYGVRGSTPCPTEGNHRYGGNTSCVALESPGHDPIVFDLGTGLRLWGETLPHDGSFHGHALVTHVHWDHVQGLPFFVPVLQVGSTFDVYGPPPTSDCSLGSCFETFVSPPYFPVTISDLPGMIRFHDAIDTEVGVGDAKVTIRSVPHTGLTNGYRVEQDGLTIVYISDHQMPPNPSDIAGEVLELCDGADLLIHDAQYTPEEFETKRDWGHCTVDYAVHVAAQSGAKRLALFHHDPSHDDTMIDRLLAGARARGKGRIEEIIAASEMLTLVL